MANEEHLKLLKRDIKVWNQGLNHLYELGIEPDLSGADLSYVHLNGVKLGGANLAGANLRGAYLREADLSYANLNGVNLRGADLVGADLSGADLSLADLSVANLNGVKLGVANLSQANLSQANLSQADLFRVKLGQANLSQAYLSQAYLSQANLSQANLRWASLSRAILSDAKLRNAYLNHAIFSQANLTDADLRGADLSGANLFEVVLSGTNLSQANLKGADLIGANFSETIVGETTFSDIDLSTVKGLETVHHTGPSTIGIDTIYRSEGNIPEAFLRGCGLRDWEIEVTKLYQPNLTSAEFTNITYKTHELRVIAIQYYSCFISYSHNDEDFAKRLHTDLQHNGVRCWFAPEDLKIGAKIRPTIDETIRLHDKLLLVLSEHSVSSQWVEQEVETALAREREQDQIMLFPIRLDNAVMEIEGGWPALVKNTRNIGNFSQWKGHDTYQKAFTRLLRDLKAKG